MSLSLLMLSTMENALDKGVATLESIGGMAYFDLKSLSQTPRLPLILVSYADIVRETLDFAGRLNFTY